MFYEKQDTEDKFVK